jgi:hypothetical protein
MHLPVLQKGAHSEATTTIFITFGPAKGPGSLSSLSSAAPAAASVAAAASALASTVSAMPTHSLASSNAVGFGSETFALASVSVSETGAGDSALGSDTGAADLLALLLSSAPFCFAALRRCFGVDVTGLGGEAESAAWMHDGFGQKFSISEAEQSNLHKTQRFSSLNL